MIRKKFPGREMPSRFRPFLVIVFLLIAVEPVVAADLDEAGAMRVRRAALAGPVDGMPDRTRRAYLTSIVDELVSRGYLPRRGGPLSVQDIASAVRRYQIDANLHVDGVASRELLDYMLFADPSNRSRRTRVVAARPADPPMQFHETVQPKDREARLRPSPNTKNAETVNREALPLLLQPVDRNVRPDVPPESTGSHGGRLQRAPSAGVPMKQADASDMGGGGFVSRVQRALRSRGYYVGAIDGVFGQETSHAVRRFQSENGLSPTGAIDAPLLNALAIS